MDSRGIKKKKLIQVLSILAVTLIILFLILNINLKLNLTGKAIESQTSLANKTTSYIYGNGLIASYDSDGNEKFYINDHLGSGSVVLDENGNKIAEESYYAFGEEKTSGDSRFTYTGKEKDDSGLYYYGARYYDSDSGRFTQSDPMVGNLQNPQSLNKYVYVLNNPINNYDPDGRKTRDGSKLIYFAISKDLYSKEDIENIKITANEFFGKNNKFKAVVEEINGIEGLVEGMKSVANENEGKIDLLFISSHGYKGYQYWPGSKDAEFSRTDSATRQELRGSRISLENDAVCVLSACFAGSSSHPALKDEVARIYAEELGVTSYGAEYSVLVGPPIKYDETQGFMGVKDWNNIFSYFTDFSNTLKYNLYKMGLKKDLS